jgi:RNA polymerase sigma-70 factor (family 1)
MTETEIKYLLNDIALNNSGASFKRLYLCFYSKLFWFAKSFVKTDEAAEEIIDDVFLNLWLQRVRLPDVNNFGNYCYMSVKNKSLTQLSKAQLNQVSIDESAMEIADQAATGEDKMICNDTTALINHSLGKLSSQCQVVFKLVKDDGLKYREVAELLNLSIKTVEYHMGNALKQIAAGIANAQKSQIAEAEKVFK